jgi:3-oxoacyl-[acyl-carrier protein] reductase
MEITLHHKNAIVCGSTQGIGLAIAKEFASSGAQVVLVARNEERLKQAVASLDNSKGQKHSYVIADFSNTQELGDAVAHKAKEVGEVHILVNNTGGPPAGPAHKAPVDEYLSAFTNHLIANQTLAMQVVEYMKAQKFGRIINIISTSVKQPLDNLGVSNTVRGAVGNWAKTLANELGPFGITVNNILPGATATERLTSIIDNKASKTGKSKEDVSNAMVGAIPAGRFCEPEEHAYAATFLASEKAAYINGTNVVIDGGRTKCL